MFNQPIALTLQMRSDIEKKTPPIFSVVMPAYNAERTIAQAIESILAQTLPDWELLIVDDCSTDRTLEVSQGFRDSRIRVFKTPTNANAAGARNLALEYASGELIAFLDSDDIAEPLRLQKQFDFFQKNPDVGVCGTYVDTFAEDPRTHNLGSIIYPCDNGGIKASMFFYDPFVTSSVALRRSALLHVRSPVFSREMAPSEDYHLWARLIETTQFANLPVVLNHYRIHPSQLTMTHKSQMLRQIEEVWLVLFEKFGRRLSGDEIALHRKCVSNQVDSAEALLAARGWLEEVWQMGSKASFLPRDAWDRLLGLKWFKVCEQARNPSPAFWSIYADSPLSGFFRSRRSKLRLFTRCLLRRDIH